MIIIDRLDKLSRIARLEVDGNFIEIPISLIPDGAREGYKLDIVAKPVENEREQHIKDLTNKLFKKKS